MNSFTKLFLSYALFFSSQVSFSMMTLSSPQIRQVYQRSSQNRADVFIEGHIDIDVARIEARATLMQGGVGVPTSWITLSRQNEINEGYFQGILTVSQGGWYQIEVQAIKSGWIVDLDNVSYVGVGEVFITAGQSNSANYGETLNRPIDDRVSAKGLKGWQLATDPQPIADGNKGSPWPILGDLLVRELKVPVGFVSCGKGGTLSQQWLPGTNLYLTLLAILNDLGPQGVRAILWHQGENDVQQHVSTDQYVSNLTSIIQTSQKDAGWSIPWLVAQVGYFPKVPQTASQAIQNAQHMLWQKGIALEGPETDSLQRSYRYDSVHFNEKGLKICAQKWFEKIMKAFKF